MIAVATIGIGARPLYISAAPAPGANAEFVAFVGPAMDTLEASLISLEREHDTDTFDRSRDAFKRVEGVAEFYSPALAAAINGRREELDDDDAALPDPRGSGFARVEKAFASAPASAARSGEIVAAASDMLVAARQLHVLLDAVHPSDAQLFEIGRQELVRASVLGVAGYDTPSTKRGVTETAQALAGLNDLYARAGYARWTANTTATARLHASLAAAIGYLRAHPDYDRFNRLEYLTAYAAPAARALQAAHEADTREWVVQPRAWRSTSAWIFDPGALDPRVYAPAAAPPPTDSLVALGARLFGDLRLSRDGVRSCAACHQPARAFSDGLARAAPLPGRSLRPTRNTPTLLNAALQPSQFDDERAVTLEDQVGAVLGSAAEMGGSVQIAARHVAASSAYDTAFARAFGDVNATPEAVTPRRLEIAVAAYVRSLVAMDSRADRAMLGDTLALTAEERRGFNLFMGKARCGSCHFAPTFGGTAPPLYIGSDVEVIGVPRSSRDSTRLDADSGRAGIDHWARDLHGFKTPSLRNVALTAPYMHNGAFATLDEVVRFYNDGGGAGRGIAVPDQTLPTHKLDLTADEQHAIVAFLRALTDTVVRSGLAKR